MTNLRSDQQSQEKKKTPKLLSFSFKHHQHQHRHRCDNCNDNDEDENTLFRFNSIDEILLIEQVETQKKNLSNLNSIQSVWIFFLVLFHFFSPSPFSNLKIESQSRLDCWKLFEIFPFHSLSLLLLLLLRNIVIKVCLVDGTDLIRFDASPNTFDYHMFHIQTIDCCSTKTNQLLYHYRILDKFYGFKKVEKKEI